MCSIAPDLQKEHGAIMTMTSSPDVYIRRMHGINRPPTSHLLQDHEDPQDAGCDHQDDYHLVVEQDAQGASARGTTDVSQSP